jgi:hypothetical protein
MRGEIVGYYRAGDYYRGGGYYRAGGLKIGSILGGIARTVVGSIPVIGGVAGAVMNAVLPPSSAPGRMTLASGGGIPSTRGQAPEPGVTGVVHRMAPGGSSGFGYYNKQGKFIEGKRPTMNVANPRAVKRAGRRMEGFLKLARRIERQLPHRTVHVAGKKACR